MSLSTISRSGSDTRHRAVKGETRLTAEEKAELTAFAATQHMSLSEYLRVAAFTVKWSTEAGQ